MEFREIVTLSAGCTNYQSFSKAARQLGYSQAAVTIQGCKQLEQELGVHLFDRIGKTDFPDASGTGIL